jgi:hypothetical protein
MAPGWPEEPPDALLLHDLPPELLAHGRREDHVEVSLDVSAVGPCGDLVVKLDGHLFIAKHGMDRACLDVGGFFLVRHEVEGDTRVEADGLDLLLLDVGLPPIDRVVFELPTRQPLLHPLLVVFGGANLGRGIEVPKLLWPRRPERGPQLRLCGPLDRFADIR